MTNSMWVAEKGSLIQDMVGEKKIIFNSYISIFRTKPFGTAL